MSSKDDSSCSPAARFGCPSRCRRMTTRVSISMLVSFSLVASGNAAEIDVYILTGQSNSLGTTGLEGPENYAPPGGESDPNLMFFWSNVSSRNRTFPAVLHGDSGGETTAIQMQQGDGGRNPRFWGPEIGLARRLREVSPRQEILILKASRGGGGNSLWDAKTFKSNPAKGHMWGHLSKTVDAGLNSLKRQKFVVRGLIYMQGESNSSAEANIADVRLAELATNLKQHINNKYRGAADGMFTVAVEVAASTSNYNRKKTTELHRKLAKEHSGFGFVETSDLPLKSDGIHFGRDAKMTYGRRIADAFMGLRPQN